MILRLFNSSRRFFSCSAVSNADFTHAVITSQASASLEQSNSYNTGHWGRGGRTCYYSQRAARDGTSTILLERHGSAGSETSSRNSEVYSHEIYLSLSLSHLQ